MTGADVGETSFLRADLMRGVLASTVGYVSTKPEERVHRGVPSPWLTFILSLDDPVVWAEDEKLLGTPAEHRDAVLVAPLHTSATYVAMPRRQAGIQMAVHPLVARQLFGASAAELARRGTTGLDVLGSGAEALRKRLVGTPTWAERFAVLDAFLRDRVDRAPASAAVRPELDEAWRWLRRSGGRRRLDALAEHVALSPRHLTTLFRRGLGLSPKRTARLVRFDAASRRLTTAVRQRRVSTSRRIVQAGGHGHGEG